MALTTDDLQQISKIVDSSLAKANFATKDDLDRLEGRLVAAINLLQRDTFARLDDHEARLERLERASHK